MPLVMTYLRYRLRITGLRCTALINHSNRNQVFRVFICCMVGLFLTNSVLATDIQVLPGDSPITIKGRIGDDNTFVGGADIMAEIILSYVRN